MRCIIRTITTYEKIPEEATPSSPAPFSTRKLLTEHPPITTSSRGAQVMPGEAADASNSFCGINGRLVQPGAAASANVS